LGFKGPIEWRRKSRNFAFLHKELPASGDFSEKFEIFTLFDSINIVNKKIFFGFFLSFTVDAKVSS
jgi:hypothetical protein